MEWRHVRKMVGGLLIEILWSLTAKSSCEYIELRVGGKRERGTYAFNHASALKCYHAYLESVEDLLS